MQAYDITIAAKEVAEKIKGRALRDNRLVAERKYDLTRLQAIHHEIIRLKLASLTNKAIAARLGVTEAVVSYTINSSLGRAKLNLMQSYRDDKAIDFNRRIQEMLPDALGIYEKILRDPASGASINLQKATADTLIKDIAGKVAPKRIDARHLHAHLTSEQIEDIKRRGYEQAKAVGLVVESD